MANPAPCSNCLEVADAEFYVTNRLGVPWPFEQSTVALCVPCFIQVGITMGTALQAAMAELEAMAEPGTLEAIEADEGPVTVAPATTKRRKTKAPATVGQSATETDAEETETPDEQS